MTRFLRTWETATDTGGLGDLTRIVRRVPVVELADEQPGLCARPNPLQTVAALIAQIANQPNPSAQTAGGFGVLARDVDRAGAVRRPNAQEGGLDEQHRDAEFPPMFEIHVDRPRERKRSFGQRRSGASLDDIAEGHSGNPARREQPVAPAQLRQRRALRLPLRMELDQAARQIQPADLAQQRGQRVVGVEVVFQDDRAGVPALADPSPQRAMAQVAADFRRRQRTLERLAFLSGS